MPKAASGYNPYNQGHTVEFPLTVVVEAHSSGDLIGGLQTITVNLRKKWFGCELRAVSVLDRGAKANASTLYLFRQLPSTFADGAAWVPLDADLRKMPPGLQSGIAINAGDYNRITTSDEGTVDLAGKPNLNIGLDLRNGTPSTFYAYLVDGTGFTPVAVDDWVVMYHFWID